MMAIHSKKIFLGIIFFIFIIVLCGPFYTQDGPNHQKTTLILSRLDTSPIESKVYSSGFGWINTNSLFPLLYQPLKNFISITLYERVFFAFFLCSLILSLRYFISIYAPSNKHAWALILPVLFHPLFLRGFYNYLASVTFSLLAISIVYREIQSGKKNVSKVFFLFLIVCWFAQLSHPFSFFIILLMISVFFLEQGLGCLRKVLPYFSVAGLFFLIQFALPLFTNGIGEKTPYTFSSIPILIGGLIGLNFMDYSVLGLLVPLPFMCCLGYLCYKNLELRGLKKNLIWIAPLIAYFLFPRSGRGSAHMNERFLPFIFFFIPASLSKDISLASERLLKISFVTFLCVLLSNFQGIKKIQEEENHAKNVLAHLPPVSKLYPINFNIKGPGKINWHLAHIWASYPEDKIVFSPYLFALPNFTPLKKNKLNSLEYFPATEEDYPRQELTRSCQSGFLYDSKDCDFLKKQALQTIFKSAQYYDYWFIYKMNPLFFDFLKTIPELELVSEEDGFSLWHYKKSKPFNPQDF